MKVSHLPCKAVTSKPVVFTICEMRGDDTVPTIIGEVIDAKDEMLVTFRIVGFVPETL